MLEKTVRPLLVPLWRALHAAGLRVWMDRMQLEVGDSLLWKIQEGLGNSRFGSVILSKSFLDKGWPQRELGGMMALEEDGRKVILPVWHGIDRAALSRRAPILADRLAANTADGIQKVAAALIRVILNPSSGSPSVAAPRLATRFMNLLGGSPTSEVVIEFLRAHPDILRTGLGVSTAASVHWKQDLEWPAHLGSATPDVCVAEFFASMGRLIWQCLVFQSPNERVFRATGEPQPSLVEAVQRLEEFREQARRHLADVRVVLPDIKPDFFGTVVAGRREGAEADASRLSDYNDTLIGLRVRTYDWLIEAAAALPI